MALELFRAAQQGDKALLRKLSKKKDFDVNRLDDHGLSAALIAARQLTSAGMLVRMFVQRS
jgi:hypothetical protein